MSAKNITTKESPWGPCMVALFGLDGLGDGSGTSGQGRPCASPRHP